MKQRKPDKLQQMSMTSALLPGAIQRKLDAGDSIRWGAMLSGGTLLGAIQPPIMRAIEALLGPPSAIAGVSIGANNGVMLSTGRHDDLRDLWASVDGAKTFMVPQADVWNGLHSVKRLHKLHVEWNTCTAFRCPTHVGMVDAATREYESVLLNDVEAVSDRRDAVVASSLQAFIMERWKYRGRYKLDGGFKHVLPVLPGCGDLDFLVSVFCSPVGAARMESVRQKDVAQAWEQGMAGIEMLLDVVVERDFRRVRKYAKQVPSLILAPESWDQIGASFDGKPATVRNRWNEVAPAMAARPVFCGGPR